MARAAKTEAENMEWMETGIPAEEDNTKKAAETVAEETRAERRARKRAERGPVKMKLFRDNGRYKDALFVAVNGKNYLVPRGVEVELPWNVAKVIERSIAQDEKTENQIVKMEEKFQEKSRNR